MRVLALTLAVAVGAQAARADDRKDDAKREVDAGLAAQAAGKYDEAIALYKKAYDAVPHPEILFDLGQAYRVKGDVETALDYYMRYLSLEPDGRVSKDAAHWVGELEKQVEARKASKAKQPAVEPTHRAEEPGHATNDAKIEVPQEPVHEPASAIVTAAPQPAPRRVAPWVLAGAAIAAGGAAIALDLWGNSTYDAAVKEPNPDTQLSLWRSANAKRYTADGFAVVGVGCAAVAVWLYFRGGDDQPTAAASIQPIAGADHAGIAWVSVW